MLFRSYFDEISNPVAKRNRYFYQKTSTMLKKKYYFHSVKDNLSTSLFIFLKRDSNL